MGLDLALTSCRGKRRYGSFEAAQKVAKRVRQQQDDSHVGAYHCKHCNGFHTGNSSQHHQHKPRPEET